MSYALNGPECSVTIYRNGPEQAETDQNEPERTETDFEGLNKGRVGWGRTRQGWAGTYFVPTYLG